MITCSITLNPLHSFVETQQIVVFQTLSLMLLSFCFWVFNISYQTMLLAYAIASLIFISVRSKVFVVSKEGLIFMKSISGRLQDLADIERLENES